MNKIEIHIPHSTQCNYTIYFTCPKTMRRVRSFVDNLDYLLDMRQKEDLFLGDKYNYTFNVSDSVIKDLSKLINWPV